MLSWLAARFELSRGDAQANVRPMEGLRGFAVLLVFCTHYVTLIGPWLSERAGLGRAAEALHTVGNAGVDLFFVLSGYLIYGSLMAKPQAYVAFMRRRVRRIYPTFLVVFAVYVLLSLALPSERKIPEGGVAASIYLVENLLLLPGLFNIVPMITVAWSLSYEMFYYLALPIAIGALGLRHRSQPLRLLFWASTSLALLFFCARLGGPVRLLLFVGGIGLWELQQRRSLAAPGSSVGLSALLLSLAAMLLPLSGQFGAGLRALIGAVGFAVLCWACFERPQGALARTFSWLPLRWLGNMSYSFYLLHGLALKASFMVLAWLSPPSERGWGWFLLWLPPMLFVALLASAALYLLIELPLSLKPAVKPR